MVVVKLKERMSKKQIMTKKENLKTGVYIDDDPTRKEREIQGKLRKLADEKRREGKKQNIRKQEQTRNGIFGMKEKKPQKK